jgi:hypothetical protein
MQQLGPTVPVLDYQHARCGILFLCQELLEDEEVVAEAKAGNLQLVLWEEMSEVVGDDPKFDQVGLGTESRVMGWAKRDV